MFWKRVKNTMLAACMGASPNKSDSTASTPHTTPGTVPHSTATVYSATSGPTTVMEKPENFSCRPKKMTRQAANTCRVKRRRSTSGTTVMARPTNTCRSGTTFTMPRYWRSARSGMMIDDAVSISCTQPKANAKSITAASTAQSRAVISRCVISKFSMAP